MGGGYAMAAAKGGSWAGDGGEGGQVTEGGEKLTRLCLRLVVIGVWVGVGA